MIITASILFIVGLIGWMACFIGMLISNKWNDWE